MNKQDLPSAQGCLQEIVQFSVPCLGHVSKRVSAHGGDIHSGQAGLLWCHCG